MYIAAVAKFKNAAYSLVESDLIFSVVIEKIGETARAVPLSIQFIEESTTSKQLFYCSNNY